MNKRIRKKKLNFSKEELKINTLEKKAEAVNQKLDAVKEKLPTEAIRKKVRIFDEKTQKPKTRIRFEETAIPINEAKWNKPKKKSLPRKTAGALTTAGANKLHSKIYEVEHENVGTEAAHKAELVGESGLRGGKKLTHSAYRFARNAPYHKVSKLEVKTVKSSMKLSYQKALQDNPGLKSNPVSRLLQKRTIKKQYATALRTAKTSAKTATQASGILQKTSKTITGLVRKSPVTLLHAGLLMLIIFAIMALVSTCGTLFSGSTGFIGATAYAAEDVDIDNAELFYTEMETDLQIRIQNVESSHSGYDEYRYNIRDFGHDPFELMGFLTVSYEDFSYSEIQAVLQQVFNEQYSLTFTPETETRTRTETHSISITDPETGITTTDTYQVEVEYEWYILNVNLASTSFYNVIYPRISTDQLEHFELLMRSKGSRQYVANPFSFNWLPYINPYSHSGLAMYGYRINPDSGVKDYHKGIDIGVPSGTEIHAGFDGLVTAAGYDAGGYGNYVVLEQRAERGTILEAKYAHCNSVLVSVGQTVSEGDIIATTGNTGDSSTPHLHLEVVKNGQYLNPLYFAVTGDDGSSRIPPGSPGGVVIPPYSGEPMGDGSFEALIAEAQRFIGYPYVWGGSSPVSSFDCSGYICWIINHSGVGSIGRTNAQGIYNLCTPVSGTDAKPGDLVFFTKTYSTPNPVTHVALYLGGDSFIHCGDPIGYASLSTRYWQLHFYAFGRLPG